MKREVDMANWRLLKLVWILFPAVSLVGCAGGGGSGDGSSIEFAGIKWVAPSERDDGSVLSLSEIAGYRVYYGEVSGVYTDLVVIDDSAAIQAKLGAIPSGEYFVVVTTIDTDGRESVYSAEVGVTL